MENKEIEDLLTNALRFFILLLITAGIMVGMGIHFLLNFFGSGFIAEIAIVTLICIGVIVSFIWAKKSNSPTAIARMATVSLLVVGLLVGMGASLLVGSSGSIMLAILMFVVVLVWGIWVFRKGESKK